MELYKLVEINILNFIILTTKHKLYYIVKNITKKSYIFKIEW